MDIIFLSGEAQPLKLCAEDRRFTLVQRMLRINQCTDAAMWYADKVGQLVPFFGAWSDGYKSREDAGHTNIVKFSDAEIVEINDKGHIQSAVSNSLLRHCITRRQDNEQSIEPQADPTSPHFTGRFTYPDHARPALQPASEYHEDYHDVIWFHFHTFEECPETFIGNSQESNFEEEHWTHFIQFDFNSIINQAEALGVAP
ncbi:hypothetical protein HQN60_00110 [Deefgea piscis]|uniref:Uncharacterized protein n=1 Tax=Deefgea piscis TaxID=2739061 RepID=A0A6M8SM04_9NEIS|nr:hypothetical protein [Deefgea piscis]QKJ65268.1 hypothetical protein HQN60_00110 [Deefgea piscis]